MRRHKLPRLFHGMTALAVVGLVASLVSVPRLAHAADHRDGPRVSNNAATIGGLDINDVYVFVSPSNPNNTVIAVTVGGAAVGILSPPVFTPGGIYQVRISNDGDPLTDELVIQTVFSDPNAAGQQAYDIFLVNARTGQGSQLARGMTGRNVNLRGGGRARAGLFDDPFFFDLVAFNKFKAAVQEGKSLGDRVAPFLKPNFPNNFFGNFNVLAIVVEVPRTRLQATRNNPDLSLWARTMMPNSTDQFDRMGNPGINTVVGFEQPLLGLPNIQDLFNSLNPAADVTLRSAAADRIHAAFGLPLTDATTLANTLLPDVIRFSTTNKSGFLNGRRLSDDVIDAELGLLTGNALTSDRVVNDSVFSNSFPYLGAPLPRGAVRAAVRDLSNLGEE